MAKEILADPDNKIRHGLVNNPDRSQMPGATGSSIKGLNNKTF